MDGAIGALKPDEKVKMTVRRLNFYYGKFQALKNINLQIPEKKVTAFIGPSGCGKSTLLRVFNRMFELYPEQRAEGEVNVDGENVLTSKEDVALIRAKIGMIFQKPTPFPMSIYDNIAFGVKLFENLPKPALDDRLGVVLYQLPPNMKKDLERLETFLKNLPPNPPAPFEVPPENTTTSCARPCISAESSAASSSGITPRCTGSQPSSVTAAPMIAAFES